MRTPLASLVVALLAPLALAGTAAGASKADTAVNNSDFPVRANVVDIYPALAGGPHRRVAEESRVIAPSEGCVDDKVLAQAEVGKQAYYFNPPKRQHRYDTPNALVMTFGSDRAAARVMSKLRFYATRCEGFHDDGSFSTSMHRVTVPQRGDGTPVAFRYRTGLADRSQSYYELFVYVREGNKLVVTEIFNATHGPSRDRARSLAALQFAALDRP